MWIKNIAKGVSLLVMCKASYTQKLKLLYMLHEPPALLDNDDFDMDVLESPTSG